MKAREPFPILYARDVERSAAFYREAFGFEETFRWPKESQCERSGTGCRRINAGGDAKRHRPRTTTLANCRPVRVRGASPAHISPRSGRSRIRAKAQLSPG